MADWFLKLKARLGTRWLFAGVVILVGIVSGIAVLAFRVGKKYQEKVAVEPEIHQIEKGESQLDIKKISLKRTRKNQEGQDEIYFLEINKSGLISEYGEDRQSTEVKKLVSYERLYDLFHSLTKEQFLNLVEDYTCGLGGEITVIILETNYGTKTIKIEEGCDLDNGGTGDLPDEFEDIIEEIEDIEEEIQPSPSPSPGNSPSPPSPSPTPTPLASPTPTSSSSPSPSPTTSPTPGTDPLIPFTCEDLGKLFKPTAISNIICGQD